MRWRPVYDPRESPKHQALLNTRSSFAYLPFALRWAFSVEVLSLAIIYGAVLGFFAGYLTALWIVLLLGSGALAWLLAVVARAEFGFGDPPQLDTRQLISIGADALRVGVVVVFAIVGFQFLSRFDSSWAQSFAWVFGALLPSILVLLAVEDSLFKALNPLRQLRLFVFGGALGWVLAVFGAWAVHRGLGALALVLDDVNRVAAIQAAPPTVGRILFGIGGLWGAAFALHWYGHALHHRHDKVGLGAVLEAAGADELSERDVEAAVKRRYAAIQRLADAQDAVGLERTYAQPAPEGVDPLQFYEMLWRELLFHRQLGAVVRIAHPLLAAAVTAKRFALARKVWLEARQRSPSFAPDSQVMERLAELATANGDHDLLKRLV